MTEKEKAKQLKQEKKANKLLVVKLCKEFAQRLELAQEKTYKWGKDIAELDLEWQQKYKELMILSVFMDNYSDVEDKDLFLILKKNKCKFLIDCYKDNSNFFQDMREFGVNEMIYRIQEQANEKELN